MARIAKSGWEDNMSGAQDDLEQRIRERAFFL
jgi:hypothetical protein